ncbi:MAG: glycosyltransferase [Patescibacteria group bacterium]|jgi:glycosyltransferase involved in cell wall biosynthesis
MSNRLFNDLRTINYLAQPAHLRQLLQQRRSVVLPDPSHLRAAIDWLLVAHASVDGKGFSGSYSFRTGWGEPYPETTGYLLPTLIEYANQDNYRRDEIMSAVSRSGEWLLSIQHPDGAFPGYATDEPIVFDTGQVIFGLCAIYRQTNDSRYLTAATRAGDWLISQQMADGSWANHEYNSSPHTYHTMIDWALLELAALSPRGYRDAAIKNLNWVVGQQQPNGWFNHFSFFPGNAILHTIAYTLQGLIESARLLQDVKYLRVAQLAADRLPIAHPEQLGSFYDDQWQSVSRSQCLTGIAQMGLVWRALDRATHDPQYAQATLSTFNYLKSNQLMAANDPYLHGALAGSSPIWGDYLPFTYPNWAAKFFIDLGITVQSDNEFRSYLIKSLAEVVNLAEKAGIRYWMTMGTLLGAIRQGGLINGDGDVDLGITIEDAPKLLALLPKLGVMGWRVDVTTFSVFVSKPEVGIMIEFIIHWHHNDQLWSPLVKIPPKFNSILKYVDLLAERAIYRDYHQNIPRHYALAYRLIPRGCDRWIRRAFFGLNDLFGQRHYAMMLPARLVAALQSVSFCGLSLPAPQFAQDYLAMIYGPTWSTPDPSWSVTQVKAINRGLFRTRDQADFCLLDQAGTAPATPRALFVSYFFPPIHSVESTMAYNSIKYLGNFGWQPIVVASRFSREFGTDPSRKGLSDNNLTVWRTLSLENLLTRLVNRLDLSTDAMWGWYPFGLLAARKALRGDLPTVIVSRSNPITSHLIARKIARGRRRYPWIALFGDPWAHNPYVQPAKPIISKWRERIERQIIAEADAVVVTTSLTRQLMISQYGYADKIHVLPNTYDPEEFRALINDKSSTTPQPFTITHAGSLYGLRSPEPLFKALQIVRDLHPGVYQDIRVNLIGLLPQFVGLVDQYQLSEVVNCSGLLPRTDTLRQLSDSDLLLSIDAPSMTQSIFLPAKLIEYLAINKPIMAITPPGTSADVINATNTGIVVDPQNVVQIAQGIVDCYWRHRAGEQTIKPNLVELEKYSAPNYAKRLAQIIDRLVGQ